MLHTLAVNGAILGVGLTTSLILARWLGPVGRGELAAAMLWPVLLAYLCTTGFIPSVLYHAAGAGAEPSRILGTACLAGLVQSTAGMLAGYILMPVLLGRQDPAVVAASRVYLAVIPPFVLTQYGIAVLQARLRFRSFNVLRSIIPTGYFAGVVALALAGQARLGWIIALHLALTFVTLFGTVYALWRNGFLRGIGADWTTARQLLGYGSKAYVGGLSQAANMRFDQGMLSAFFPPVQLGLYVAAISASSLLGVLTTAVQMVSTPRLASEPDRAIRTHLLHRVVRRYGMLAMAGTAMMLLMLPFAIPLVFGREFQGAVAPALILTVGMMFMGGKEVLSAGAQAFGDPWLGSRAEIAGALVMLVALPITLPAYGIIGAASAAATAYAIQFLVMLTGLNRARVLPMRTLLHREIPM